MKAAQCAFVLITILMLGFCAKEIIDLNTRLQNLEARQDFNETTFLRISEILLDHTNLLFRIRTTIESPLPKEVE